MSRETTSAFARREPVQIYSNKLRAVKFTTYSVVKRVLDFMFSAVFLVVLSPLFLLVAILIKIDSPGPVFFRQKRTGRDGKDFYILKFRSMAKDNNVYDNTCGDKYTRVGSVIRKISVDELPQFINVLLGQMSFIGPRPWVTEYWANMNEVERGRAKVRPGITGLAAAKGRNGLTIFEKISYDLEYVENFSFWQDIKIVFWTIKTIAKREEVDAGKGGIHNDIKELKERKPHIRVILNVDPLVSVAVPVENKDMKVMINSALEQTYDNLELILLNDSVTAKMRRIIKDISSDNIKIVNPYSKKSGAIQNNGDCGKVFCYIETDNIWRPGKVVQQLEKVELALG